MYNLTTTNNPEPHNPTSTQYPLRPASRTSPIRINVLKSLRLHRVTAILVTLLVLGLGLAVVARHKPYYGATSTIYVSPTVPKTLTEDHELDRPYESYVQEIVHDIDRYDILVEAIHKMPAGLWLYPDETERAGVARLQHSLEIERLGTTYQVAITLGGYRPEHLADIVNTVTKVYIEKARSEEYYGRDDRLATLNEELNHIQSDSDALLKEQAQITKELGVASFNSKGSNVIDEGNAKMQTDLTAAHELRMQAESQLAALNSGDSTAPNSALNAAADEIIASDPGLMALKTSLSQQQATLQGQIAGMTEKNTLRQQTEGRLAQIDKAIQDMQTNLRRKAAARLDQKLRTQLKQAQMYESKLNSDLQHGTKLASDAAPRIQRAEEIQAKLTSLQARYTAVDDRISQLQLESSSPGSVHLFSPAMTPLSPEKSKIKMLLILIFPVSIFLGVLTAVALDLLDPHIYTAMDVEAVLGFAPIGMLYDDREVTQIVFDECALRMAAGVDHAARQSGARTFVITAVNSGAGTTSIIESLGSMLAKLGRKTLVIDPSGNSEPVAFVTFGADLQKRPVNFPDPSAGNPSTTTELQTTKPGRPSLPVRVSPLNGFVFESFQSLSAEYDIVLIDAAPLLISAETEYLARMADVTMLVSEAGKTHKRWLTRAARLLERLGVAGAAAVVNKVNPSRIEEALKHDLREFELRSDRVNLQEWWKPGKKATHPAATPAAPYARQTNHAEQEDVIYARDI
jgi:polysaccharide biosynthesis transport protein